MAACFMANCQVLSFDKVHNGQKVKPTHRTHTHFPHPLPHISCAQNCQNKTHTDTRISLEFSFVYIANCAYVLSQVNFPSFPQYGKYLVRLCWQRRGGGAR